MTAASAHPQRARYYDPTIGRFLTRDPLPGSPRDPSFPEGLNAYPYVQNNPVNRVDPSGMLTEATLFPTDLVDLLRELLQGKSCGEALADIYVGLVFVAAALVMFAAAAGGPVIWVGGGALAVGAILLVRGYLSYADNCSFQQPP